MRIVLVAACALAILGCSAEPEIFGSARSAVTAELKDPNSVQFRNLRVVKASKGADMVCGEFNAKNSFGGYVGYEPFLWGAAGVLMPGSDGPKARPILTQFITRSCAGDERGALAAVGVDIDRISPPE